MTADPQAIAKALGGEVSGGQVLAPGPGHSAADRSLSFKLDSAAPEGFVVHSFAGDDPIKCRAYVREKLGLPDLQPKKSSNGKAWSPVSASYIYRDRNGAPYLRVQRTASKQFFQQHWDGANWIKGKPQGPKIPYRLPELLAAAPTMAIYVCEGEKDCDNLAKIDFTATTNSEGADNGKGTKWTPDLNVHFKDRTVVILPDNDKPGRKHAEHVARGLHSVAKSVRVVELPGLPPGGDVTDWLETDPSGARLVKACERAPLWEPGAEDVRISELAGLSKLDYARRRKEEAKRLGIPATALDDAVKDARIAASGGKLLYEHWNVEPWPEAVDTAALLQSIQDRIKRHVIVSDAGALAVALWTAMSWVHERSAVHSPILMVTSVERDSGKTTLLGVLGFLIRRSLLSVSVSAAPLYRSIEKWQPSFVIDEADAIFRDNELLREVINASWTRGQGVLRCQPETNEPFLFPTFCPKVIGLKGRKLPDTTLNRSIIVELKRKLPTEKVTDFLHIDDAGLAELRRKLARWANDNADRLTAANPVAPEGFINRVAANWRLLLSIAELAGGDWPERARKAAMVLVGPETSLGIKLLSDVRDAFIAKDAEELSTQELVDYLTGLEDRDWSELNRGKPVTKVWLSRQLGKFGLASGNVGERGSRLRGWRFDTFTEAFARYLSVTPPANSHTRTQPHGMGTSYENELAHAKNGVRVGKSQKPNNDGLVGECAGLKEGSPREDDYPDLPASLRRVPVCAQCNAPGDARGALLPHGNNGKQVWLHAVCVRFWEGRWGA